MIDQITAYAKKKAKEFEIYYVESDDLNVQLAMDKVNFISEGVTKGFGIRVANKGKIGFSFTTNMDSYQKCIDNAVKISKVSNRDPSFVSFAPRKPFKRIKTVNDELLDFDVLDFNDFFKDFVGDVKETKRHVIVSDGAYRKNVLKRNIVNSEGVDVEDRSADNLMFFDLSLKRKDSIETLPVSHCSRGVFDSSLAKGDAERFLANISKRRIGSNKMPVVMHPDALGELLSNSLAFSVNAENVQQKKSLFVGKLNKPLFDEKVTFFDDGITEDLFASQNFDCEGSPSKKTTLFKNGVLKSFLYDSYTANKEGVLSTGNADRSLMSVPTISMNNLVMGKGDCKDPLKEIKKGIFVRELLGVHTMNQATGDFSLGVMEGFYIERGEIQFPLKDVMISGNVLEMLKNVACIGKDVIHSTSGNGGTYMPEVLFPEVSVIGKD